MFNILAASWQNQQNDFAQRRFRSAWPSESSLSAWRKLGSLATHWAHSEDSGQTGWMSRLIWAFAGRTRHFVGSVMRRLIYWSSKFRGGSWITPTHTSHIIDRPIRNEAAQTTAMMNSRRYPFLNTLGLRSTIKVTKASTPPNWRAKKLCSMEMFNFF